MFYVIWVLGVLFTVMLAAVVLSVLRKPVNLMSNLND